MRLIQQHLPNRKQRVKVGNKYSSQNNNNNNNNNNNKTPQGLILGPVIFKVSLFDLFYYLYGVAAASYAEDTPPYSANKA